MKLGEVISKAKTVKCKERVLPVLSITMRDGFVLQSDKFKKEIASKDKSSYNVVKRNQLVQSIHIDEGGFAVQTLVDEGIVSPAYRIWDVDTSKVDGEYLSTILRSPRSIAFYKSKLRGSIQRRGKIDDADILGMDIPVPSIPEQYQILDELHLLTGIIDKQKAQLQELDTLAQSIFYDMFGDPNEERRWDSVLFESVCSSMTKGPFGSDIKKSLYVPKSDSTYKVYIQANAIEKDLSLGTYYITKEYFDTKMYRFEVRPFDYIITCDGTLGRYIQLPQNIERGIISASLLRITLKDSIAAKYFEYLWDNYLMGKLISDIRNSALVHLPSASKIGKVMIPLPPLTLQQSFAQKIQSIESQKASINRSIEETQKLFDYTMDKYFG